MQVKFEKALDSILAQWYYILTKQVYRTCTAIRSGAAHPAPALKGGEQDGACMGRRRMGH